MENCKIRIESQSKSKIAKLELEFGKLEIENCKIEECNLSNQK